MVKKKGLRSLAVGFVPAKANPVEQKKFIDETLLPLIQHAKSGSVELFFMDASHFVMGGFPGRVWSLVRRFVKTASGRKRYNVLGALNFVTGRMETVCNNTYITATQVVKMLEMLAAKCSLPIHIVLDNVPYQKCQLVKDAAKRLSIELHYLPTYSPNLNLIERVWKFVKGRVLNSAYFETFDGFCKNIMSCVNNLHTIHHADMQRLITPNFHIIDDKLIIFGKRLGS
jgi:transposase